MPLFSVGALCCPTEVPSQKTRPSVTNHADTVRHIFVVIENPPYLGTCMGCRSSRFIEPPLYPAYALEGEDSGEAATGQQGCGAPAYRSHVRQDFSPIDYFDECPA